MTTNHYNYENDIFEGDLEEDYEPYEPAIWYEEDYGYQDYEPSPYDGTYSEC